MFPDSLRWYYFSSFWFSHKHDWILLRKKKVLKAPKKERDFFFSSSSKWILWMDLSSGWVDVVFCDRSFVFSIFSIFALSNRRSADEEGISSREKPQFISFSESNQQKNETLTISQCEEKSKWNLLSPSPRNLIFLFLSSLFFCSFPNYISFSSVYTLIYLWWYHITSHTSYCWPKSQKWDVSS